MTHMIDLTKEQAEKLSAERMFFKVTERAGGLFTDSFVIGKDSLSALANWARYNSDHSPKRSLHASVLLVRRVVQREITNTTIQIGAIASEEDMIEIGTSLASARDYADVDGPPYSNRRYKDNHGRPKQVLIQPD